MFAIPGKACGKCSFCCKVLEIAQSAKPAGKLWEHCLNAGSGGCGIYAADRKFAAITNACGRVIGT